MKHCIGTIVLEEIADEKLKYNAEQYRINKFS